MSSSEWCRLQLTKNMDTRATRQHLQAWALVALARSSQRRRTLALGRRQLLRRLQRRFALWRQLGARIKVRCHNFNH
jgi:hypothetical protein